MTTTTEDTKTGTFLWTELTFPEEIHVRLWGILSSKNIFFWFSVVESQMQLHFLGAGYWKLQPNTGKLFLATRVVFLQVPQQKPKRLLSKRFRIDFSGLNLQKQLRLQFMWLFSKSESSSENCSWVVTTGSQYLKPFAVHTESLAEDLRVTAQKILILALE